VLIKRPSRGSMACGNLLSNEKKTGAAHPQRKFRFW
jgi:hypothetical protein